MKQMTLELIPSIQRPTVNLDKFYDLRAMIDTGAVYPIWMVGEEKLSAIGAIKVKDEIEFGGIGGMTVGAIYKIPMFQIGDLIYPNMGIIAHKTNFPVPILLPATMFNNLIYEINNKTHRLSITVPDDESNVRNLTIKDENGKLHIFCSSMERNVSE